MTQPPHNEFEGAGLQRVRIGGVVVDLRYSRLLRDDQEMLLPPRAFDLLALFLSRPGELLSREDIFRLVWKDVLVEDANLTQTVWLLRRALGDEGRSWIRTVSKRGYVFEAPPVEVLAAAPPPNGMPEEPSPNADWRTPQRWIPLAVGVVLALSLLLAWFVAPSARGIAPDGPIVIVETVGEGANDPIRSAVALSHEWLAWQLGDLHRMNVAPAAAGVDGADLRVLLLSAHADVDPARIVLDAKLVGRGAGGRWQVTGPNGDLSALVDALGRKVVDALRPGAADLPGVTFALPPDAARRYASAVQARRAGRSVRMLADLEDVVQRAPNFPLARLQLAQRFAELGRTAAAREHIGALGAWIDALPAGTRDVVDAQRAESGQDFRRAAQRYAALAAAHPRQWRFRLAQARSLLRDDYADQALSVLADSEREARAASLLVESLLVRAEAQLAVGAAHDARVAAERADAIAKRDERGTAHAQALMLVALADMMTNGSQVDIDGVQHAAVHFESAGDEFSALRAKILVARLSPASSGDSAQAHLDALLAKARSAGNHAVEVQALRDRSQLALRSEDFDAYRRYLIEAEAVAQVAADRVQLRRVEADLIYDDLMRGDYASARKRAELWKNESWHGVSGADLGLNLALLDFRGGHYTASLDTLRTLEETNAGGGTAGAPTVLALTLACRRGLIRLAQGMVEEAQRLFSTCADAQAPLDRLVSELGLATLAMLSGDLDGAHERVESLRSNFDAAESAGQRAAQLIYLVPLLARLGDLVEAKRVVNEGLSYARRSGFRQLEWIARLRDAEIALIENRVDDASNALEQVQRLLPPDDWKDIARASLLGAAVAMERGDDALALATLAKLRGEAQARGDVVVQLEAMSLARGRLDAIGSSDAARAGLVARSGMRGASSRWLVDASAPH